LTVKEKTELCSKIDTEGGFDYTFMHYSDFPEIKDKTFHTLVNKFREAYSALASYIDWDTYEG
jgi:hypothetical protein